MQKITLADAKKLCAERDNAKEAKDYQNDYNALMPLIRKQSDGIKIDIEGRVAGSQLFTRGRIVFWYDATCPQLFTALLAAWGYEVEG